MFRLIACLLLLSSVSQASGKLVMDARLDGQSQTFNDEAGAAGLGHNNFRYLLKTARLDYSNAFNEQTSVRARAILNTTQGAVQNRDSVNGTVDLFFINHKAADNFEITLGKFSSEMGGWEHQVSSPDMYLFSQAYTGGSTALDALTRAIFTAETGGATAAAFTWANTGTVRYYTGVKGTYKFADQEVALHTANLNSDDTTGGTSSQTRTLTGLVYKGNFGEKMFQPVLSYHEAYLPSAGSSDAKVTFATAGVRFVFDENIFDLDYINNIFKSRTAVSTGGFKDDSIKSLNLAWGKTFGQWTPKIKLERSEMVAAEEKIFDVNGYGVALEYRPVADQNFRYHLAYNSKEYAPKSGSNLKQDEIIVGARIAADILK